MAQTINTNVMSLNAQRNLASTQSSLATTMQRLSSGLRVNSARDDSAGLAIAERMSAQVRGMNVGIRNANDAVSLAQTAEGALGRITDNLQRMRELAVQSANASNSEDDRANLNTEYTELAEEVERVLNNTVFSSSTNLLNEAKTLSFQVGAKTTENDQVDIELVDLRAGTGMAAVLAGSAAEGIGGEEVTNSLKAMDDLDAAIDEITSARARFGAAANRFESVIGALQTSSENAAASRGRIVDADFAVETANLSRTQILQQAGSAMLAQANQMPQMVMNLLR